MTGKNWTNDETVLAVYLFSRNLRFAAIADLLERRAFEKRNSDSIRTKIQVTWMRHRILGDLNSVDPTVVDAWCQNEVPNIFVGGLTRITAEDRALISTV